MPLLNVVMIILYLGSSAKPTTEIQFRTMESCALAAEALSSELNKRTLNHGFVVACVHR